MVSSDPSLVADFFENQVVFVTGGTGFLGKVIIEKLLRVCSGVEKVCLLIREKKGRDPQERFYEIFESPIFDLLRHEQPEFMTKVRVIIGDCGTPNFGMSADDRDYLTSHVSCVIHAAAVVNFDESLRNAIYANVRAVKDLIRLAEAMPKLKAMVHVSTAYAHCIRNPIREQFVDVPIPGNTLIHMADCFSEEALAEIERVVLREWPNTYVFTKAAAEQLIEDMGKKLPITIIRPSMIMPVAESPLPGWVANFYGPIGVVIGVGMGGIRVIRARQDKLADMVPVDYVANAVLVAAWDTGRPRPYIIDHERADEKKIAIYNFVSTPQNPITWGRFNELMKHAGLKYYSVRCVWYYCLLYVPNWFFYQISSFLLHILPGCIIDTVMFMIFKKPLVLNFYKKTHKFLDVISYFAMREWYFSNEGVQALWNRMGAKDQQLFKFNMADLDWNAYLEVAIKGGRIYLLNDPLDTIEEGQRWKRMLSILHYLVLGAFCVLMVQFLEKILKFVFEI